MAIILLVDDNELSRDYYKLLLVDAGYNVVTANDGVKGVACLRENENMDIIISDMQMPPGEWGGIWFIEQLKSSGIIIPIIVLSEKGTISKAVEAIKLGAKEYVEKARAEQDLIPVIEKLLLQTTHNKKTNINQTLVYYETLQKAFGYLWNDLLDDTKKYIANSENIYHKHSHDTNFDFSMGIMELAKAIELEYNDKFVSQLKKFALKNTSLPRIFIKKSNGQEAELKDINTHLALGQLAYLLRCNVIEDFCKIKGIRLDSIRSLERFLSDLRIKYRRNDAAHSDFIDLKTYEALRAEIFGISKISPLKILIEISKGD